jgi:hypothetical protein
LIVLVVLSSPEWSYAPLPKGHPVSIEQDGWVRGFGTFIAVTEAHAKTLANAGLEDTALDKAVHLLGNIGDSPVGDIFTIIGIYACLGFTSGQLGDVERLNRFVMQYV